MVAGIISETSVFYSTLILLLYLEDFNAKVKSFASLKNYMRQTTCNSWKKKNICSYIQEILKIMLNLKIHSPFHSCSTLVPTLIRRINPHPHILFLEINLRICSHVLAFHNTFLHDLGLCTVCARCKALITLRVNTPVFWCMTPCRLVYKCKHICEHVH